MYTPLWTSFTLTILHTRLAILSPVQLRGLDSAIRQAMQVTHTALHYTHELTTTFGVIHTLDFDTDQLEAELRGFTFFETIAFLTQTPVLPPLRRRLFHLHAGLRLLPHRATTFS